MLSQVKAFMPCQAPLQVLLSLGHPGLAPNDTHWLRSKLSDTAADDGLQGSSAIAGAASEH